MSSLGKYPYYVPDDDSPSQKAWSAPSPTRNPVHLRLWNLYTLTSNLLSWNILLETGTLVGPWSDPKSGFSGTKGPNSDL